MGYRRFGVLHVLASAALSFGVAMAIYVWFLINNGIRLSDLPRFMLVDAAGWSIACMLAIFLGQRFENSPWAFGSLGFLIGAATGLHVHLGAATGEGTVVFLVSGAIGMACAFIFFSALGLLAPNKKRPAFQGFLTMKLDLTLLLLLSIILLVLLSGLRADPYGPGA